MEGGRKGGWKGEGRGDGRRKEGGMEGGRKGGWKGLWWPERPWRRLLVKLPNPGWVKGPFGGMDPQRRRLWGEKG